MKQNKNNIKSAGLRTCFVCKTATERQNLLRFVVGPDSVLSFDAQHVLPGRGIWVHAHGDCLKKAIDHNLFSKPAKGLVRIPESFYDSVQNNLHSCYKEG